MRKFLLGAVCFAGILSGCTQSNTDQTKEIHDLKKQVDQMSLENEALRKTITDEREALEVAMNEQANSDYSTISSKNIEKYPQTLYKKKSLDIDEDGEEEIIELYVNAGKMENGLFAWDDGQNWLLLVQDGENSYPLFDDYIQLGSLDFSTATFDGKPGIVMHMTQHSNIIIQKITYDQKVKGLQKETFYKKENMNDYYNPPASYALFKDAYELMGIAFEKTVPIQEASENTLQDPQEIWYIIEPVLQEFRNAQHLFELAFTLNPELNVSLNGPITFLNEMIINTPTAVQVDQLKTIYRMIKESEIQELIIEENNQLHPSVRDLFQKFDSTLNVQQSS
ncbi:MULTISPECIES: hypothetical protein [Solibacillus]|uniref:Lipoprotein n=1 Tax=Solibacillus merdavium TaxID=2762218 RepID=A0ABR8XQ99_9BACL|nr:hypothetical protein [Solibacillus merdavium]MBD8034128.1 hypothetical protein [Solibacillus merdavium]